MNLNEYLKDKAESDGVTANEFAKQLGISKSFLSQIRHGRAKMPIYIAKKIEAQTNGVVSRSDLRPDVWGDKK